MAVVTRILGKQAVETLLQKESVPIQCLAETFKFASDSRCQQTLMSRGFFGSAMAAAEEAADAAEPQGTAPEGHGFSDNSPMAEARFGGEERVYGKIQEKTGHVAEKSKGIQPPKQSQEETLESTGYDMSKMTVPSGSE